MNPGIDYEPRQALGSGHDIRPWWMVIFLILDGLQLVSVIAAHKTEQNGKLEKEACKQKW